MLRPQQSAPRERLVYSVPPQGETAKPTLFNDALEIGRVLLNCKAPFLADVLKKALSWARMQLRFSVFFR